MKITFVTGLVVVIVNIAGAMGCENDSTWKYITSNDVTKTCDDVAAARMETRCSNWVDPDDGRYASEVCPVACNTCPTPSPTIQPSAFPSTSPSYSPLADCLVLSGGLWTESQRDEFCNEHESRNSGSGCCNESNSCDNWNLNAKYTICKGSCRGNDACNGLSGDSISSSSVEISIGKMLV